MKVLYLATTGAGDPTKASLPLHIAGNGSVEAGVGIPPLRDLFRKLLDNDVPVYV
jgi:hypothetical protein